MPPCSVEETCAPASTLKPFRSGKLVMYFTVPPSEVAPYKRDEAIFNPHDSRNRAVPVDSLLSIQRPLKLCQGWRLVKNSRAAPRVTAPALPRSSPQSVSDRIAVV